MKSKDEWRISLRPRRKRAFGVCIVALGLCAAIPINVPGKRSNDPPARYVDAAVTHSGDGLSWTTAWKTISEAAAAELSPGTVVHIRPGIY